MTTLAYLCYLAVIPLIFILLTLSAMALWQYLKYLSLSKDLKESYDRQKRMEKYIDRH